MGKTRIYLPTLTQTIISKETAEREELVHYSVVQYAALKYVSKATVRYWIRNHQVKAFKHAGVWWIVEKKP